MASGKKNVGPVAVGEKSLEEIEGLKPIQGIDKGDAEEIATECTLDAEEVATSNVDDTNICHKVASTLLLLYTVYVLMGLIGWISHLGVRLPWTQNFLLAKGYASNAPVDTVFELVWYNLPCTLLFIIPHSFFRSQKMMKLVGFRYGRILYCTIASFAIHAFLLTFRPLNMNIKYQECLDNGNSCEYVYDESLNVPIFTMPYPQIFHDILSVSMLLYGQYCMFSDYRTYIILGFFRAYYGPKSGKDKFPKELSPRMDIITWMGYSCWLRGGSLGFILFSGLSIIPYKVYKWDIIVRVVAAMYLRHRSQGFRIWIGKIEHTHHLIFVLRAAIATAALGYQYMLLTRKAEGNGTEANAALVDESIFNFKSLAILAISAISVAVVLDRLEKIK